MMDILAVLAVIVATIGIFVAKRVQNAYLRSRVRVLYKRFDQLEHGTVQVRSDEIDEGLPFVWSRNERKNGRDIYKHPPRKAELILTFALKAADQEVILGDMQERFHQTGKKFGYRHAKRWYLWETARTVSSQIVPKLTKIGVVAYLMDLVRKIIAP
jgi:hypothetical protein